MPNVDFVHNIPANTLLTCIIPLRYSVDRPDVCRRLKFMFEDPSIPESVGFVVVDDGSVGEKRESIMAHCDEHHIGYIHIDSADTLFSVGRCRNVGAMYARSPWVLMQDVDLVPFPHFYQKLLCEIQVQGLESDGKKFLMVPYIFLSEQGSAHYFATPKELRAQQFQHFSILNEKEWIEKTSTGTSANVYNRLWYLSCGGNVPDFKGWGFEDLEFNCRMIRHLHMFPVPQDWSLQKWNFSNVPEYKSWKAVYRLFGDMLFMKGLYFAHIWHGAGETNTRYTEQKDRNYVLFTKRMAPYAKPIHDPAPLPDMAHGGQVTLLTKNCPFTYAKEFAPLLGRIIVPSQELLAGEVSLTQFVAEQGVTRIMFHNPYADPAIKALYDQAREHHLAFWVAERGALPNSTFFDSQGFLVDGDSYQAKHWDHAIPEQEYQETLAYINKLVSGESFLEHQTLKAGEDMCRKKLHIPPFKNILFVALQCSFDTVTTYFCGPLGSYDNFMALIEETANQLPADWVMVVKKHPLETDVPLPASVIDANDMNIHDLLDMSQVLLTFNSGVGVLSMAHAIPTLVAGQAFYQHQDLNTVALTVEEVLAFLQSPQKPKWQSVIRFYHYLLHQFYSFGLFTTKPVVLPSGKNITATTAIDYLSVRGLSPSALLFSQHKKSIISPDSMLFDRYRQKTVAPPPKKLNSQAKSWFRRKYNKIVLFFTSLA